MEIESDVKRKPLSWKLWLGALVVWTLLLSAPGNWFPGHVHSAGGMGAGKLLHVGAYAALAGSAGWLPGSMRRRTAIALLLILHGGMTEWIQTIVPFRDGCWRDVGIDTISILIGWLASRRMWPA
jgi:VanZ family protein